MCVKSTTPMAKHMVGDTVFHKGNFMFSQGHFMTIYLLDICIYQILLHYVYF